MHQCRGYLSSMMFGRSAGRGLATLPRERTAPDGIARTWKRYPRAGPAVAVANRRRNGSFPLGEPQLYSSTRESECNRSNRADQIAVIDGFIEKQDLRVY